MSLPPVQTSALDSGSRLKSAPRGRRGAERLALALALAFSILALALWLVPPMLDWSGYRDAIAVYASARLGRHVAIDGHVGLSLIPRVTMTAGGVTLADRGDGVSARLGTMRLEVSPGALLAGHLVPRALTLDNPVASLPWPIPRGAAKASRPAVAPEFSASLMGGTLHLGGVTFSDIAAGLHTDTASGAFGAQGSVTAAGLPWRFTAQVGAPDADGTASLTLRLDGQAPYGRAKARHGLLGTGGAFHGRILADGTVAGMLTLSGPDLSMFGPAPALPWQVSGSVRGDGITLRGDRLQIVLGQSSGTARLSANLDAAGDATLQLSLGRVELGPWAWSLLTATRSLAGHVSGDIDLSAGAAVLAGETLEAPHAVLSLRNGAIAVRSTTATLPGRAALDFTGAFDQRDDLTGTLHLQAPDARHTLHWLTQGGSDALPEAVLRKADVAGTLSLAAGAVSLDGLSGRIDGNTVSGHLAVRPGPRTFIDADLQTASVDAAAWLPWLSASGSVPQIGRLASPYVHTDARLLIRADRLLFGTLALDHAAISADGGASGLTVRAATATFAGGTLALAGSVGADGTIAGGSADYSTQDAALLPAAWRVPAALWRGPLHIWLGANGGAMDTKTVIGADLGDLRMAAEAHLDRTIPRATATLTLRHPGAPRLLASAGLDGAEAWLDHGSFAFLSHLVLTPGHVAVSDFSLAAAAFHAGGALDADLSRPVPLVTGTLDAAELTLPGAGGLTAAALPWRKLSAFDGDLAIRSTHVLADLRPVASAITARLVASGGVVALQDVSGHAADGAFTLRAAADATQTPPMLSAQWHADDIQLRLPDAGGACTLACVAGEVSGDAAFTAQGATTQDLLESADGTFTGTAGKVTVSGIDLPALSASLTAHGPRARAGAASALQSGRTDDLSGDFSAKVDHGSIGLTTLALGGQSGTVSISGFVHGGGGTDLRARVTPAGSDVPAFVVRYGGTWPALVQSVDLPPSVSGSGTQHRPVQRKARGLAPGPHQRRSL